MYVYNMCGYAPNPHAVNNSSAGVLHAGFRLNLMPCLLGLSVASGPDG